MSVSGHPATLGRFKPERRKLRGLDLTTSALEFYHMKQLAKC